MASGARRTCGRGELGAFAMIGVIADASQHDVVREFFELFKTPWEFYREDQHYEVLLCAGDHKFNPTAKLGAVYAGKRTGLDAARYTATRNDRNTSCILTYEVKAIPLYGKSISFPHKETPLLKDVATQEC